MPWPCPIVHLVPKWNLTWKSWFIIPWIECDLHGHRWRSCFPWWNILFYDRREHIHISNFLWLSWRHAELPSMWGWLYDSWSNLPGFGCWFYLWIFANFPYQFHSAVHCSAGHWWCVLVRTFNFNGIFWKSLSCSNHLLLVHFHHINTDSGCNNPTASESACRICGGSTLLPDPSRLILDTSSDFYDTPCGAIEFYATQEINYTCAEYQSMLAEGCCGKGSNQTTMAPDTTAPVATDTMAPVATGNPSSAASGSPASTPPSTKTPTKAPSTSGAMMHYSNAMAATCIAFLAVAVFIF